MKIEIEVPDDTDPAILKDLPSIYQRGLDAIVKDSILLDECRAIVSKLVTLPSADEVLGIKPSEAMQARVEELLRISKSGSLSESEQAEWDAFRTTELLLRLAKSKAENMTNAA